MTSEKTDKTKSIISQIGEELNFPKILVEQTIAFAKTVFGSAMTELGELFTDRVRYWRYKNQVNILIKASELIKKKGSTAKPINFKILVPLLENSSLESEPKLQDLWAKLISNLATEEPTHSDSNYVKTLSNLSTYDAKMLDWIIDRQIKNLGFQIFDYPINMVHTLMGTQVPIKKEDMMKSFGIGLSQYSLQSDFNLSFGRLLQEGLIEFNIPEITLKTTTIEHIIEKKGGKVTSIRKGDSPEVKFTRPAHFLLSVYGFYFLRMVKSKEE